MSKKFSIPSSYSLIKKKETYLLLHDEFKERLLQMGIENPDTFLTLHPTTSFLDGRRPHPSIMIRDDIKMVIRKYSHGGFLRAFSRALFLSGTRSFKELSLTEEVRSSGIPTIKPIGAIHQVVFRPFYRAYFLSLEISNARDMTRYFQENSPPYSPENLLHKRKTIKEAGLLIQQFHQKGFYHRDLQLKNLLVAGDQVLIIDFDRSYRKERLSRRERIRNLLRLNRSVEKWKRTGLPITKTDRWRFIKAYAGEDLKFIKAMEKAFLTHSLGLFFHKIGWMLQRIVR